MKKQDHIRPMTQKKKHYSLEKANRPKKRKRKNKQTNKDSCGFIQENICIPVCNRVAIGLVLARIDSSYRYYKIPQPNMVSKFQP